MRRATRVSLAVLALPVAAVLSLVIVCLALNTDAGRRTAERAVHRLSAQRVTVTGLAGRFPDDLRLASLTIADADGIWLTAQDASLRWSPWSLLAGPVHVERLHARQLVVARAPRSDGASASRSSLPRTLEVAHLSLDLLELGAALVGTPATLNVSGSARLRSVDDAMLAIDAERLDAVGHYHARVSSSGGAVSGDLRLQEPADGALAHLLQLPGLGEWTVTGRVAGPRGAETVALQIDAGSLHAEASGSVDWPQRSADLRVAAHSQRMAPRKDLGWRQLDLDGHWRGTLVAPTATAQLTVQDLAAGDGRVRTLTATLAGDARRLTLEAVADGVRLPGSEPDLLRAEPVRVTATLDPSASPRTVAFSVSHALAQVRGDARFATSTQVNASVHVPSLAPFAALAGNDVRGAADLQLRFAGSTGGGRIDTDGTVGITGGDRTLVALAGRRARLRARVSWNGAQLRFDEARFDGATLQASMRGERSARQVWSLQWQAGLSQLAALDAALAGSAEASGHVEGAPDALQADAVVRTEASFHGSPSGPLEARVIGHDLLTQPAVTLSLHGMLDAAPLDVEASALRNAAQAWRIRVPQGRWKSARLTGDMTVPTRPVATSRNARGVKGAADGPGAATGQLQLQLARLEDLQRLVGTPLSGSLDASMHATAADRLSAQLTATGVHVQGMVADARVGADGTLDALTVTTEATLRGMPDGDVQWSSRGLLDLSARQVRIDSLDARYRELSVRLRKPTRVAFGDVVKIDDLQLAVGSGVVQADGQLSPALDARVALRELSAAEVAKWLPANVATAVPSAGHVSGDASLRGPPQAPQGTVHLTATGLRWRSDVAQGLPPLDVDARLELRGEQAGPLALQLTAGNATRLTVDGAMPTSPTAALDLHVRGDADAGLANGFLEASGRRAAGKLSLDGRLAGTVRQPQISGRATLRDGDLRDFTAGVHVGAISADLEARDGEVVLTRFDSRAGGGSVQGSGRIAVLKSGMPLSLQFTARDAQPIDGPLLRARLDADLKLDGEATGQLRLSGRISASRAEITLPASLPTSVATLDVRRPGAAARTSAAVEQPLAVDVTIDAPRAVFVRGRGLDAEVGGELRWRGTRTAPRVSGGFELRSGRFNLAGKTLEFQSGRVSFNGQGVANQLDPTLEFVASNTSGGITSTLKVTGYADAPLLSLSSSPELPQDQVLARLLFGADITELSALQLAQMGAAVATLGGVGGGGGPLLSLQRSLGLDRLAISGAEGQGTGAVVEAGRYVSRRVYVGTRQSTSGNTQGEVEVDLTRRLKMRAAFGAGAGTNTASAQGTTPTDQAGGTVGLSYEVEF